MGRGRAKAKQQKVARELKYNSSHFTDLDALRRELSGSGSTSTSEGNSTPPPEWDDYGDEEEDDWATAR